MITTLQLRDRLAPPRNHDAYMEVLDPHPHGGCIKVFDSTERQDRYIPIAQIHDEIYRGKITVLRAGKPRYSLAAQPDDAELHENNQFARKIMGRIKEIQKQRGVSFRHAYQLMADEYEKNASQDSRPLPRQATMYRYRERDLAGEPMLRGKANQGNRSLRHPIEIINTICVVAEDLYLVPHSRLTLADVLNEVNMRVHGELHPKVARPISLRFIQKTIQRYLSADPEHDRMLPEDAIAGKSIAAKRIIADLPLQRVEQDAVHLPFYVETEDGVTSDLWLIHAIDCATSYPLGWRLVVGSPTEREALACIEMYMAPLKLKQLKELGVDHEMNICGTPGLLVFDNGPENKSARIDNLEKLGTETRYCRGRAGQEKPFIERLNRSLKEAIGKLTGSTRFDDEDGTRDPVKLGDHFKTKEELERWIVRWYYEKWIHKPLKRLEWDVVLSESLEGGTPYERWKYFESSCYAISLPPSRAEWLAALYSHVERKLSRNTGITIDGFHFKGDNLPGLIARYGEQQYLHVLYNRDDFREVYIYDGDDVPLIELKNELATEETPAYSFAEAKEKLKKHRAGFKPAPQAEKFDHDLHQEIMSDARTPKRKRPSRRQQNQETKARTRETEAVKRAARRPAPPLHPSAQPSHTTPSAAPSATASFADIPPLAMLNRNNGEELI
ncbi:integrase [Burkholderia sp. SRS-W-2-2016]|uniref:Mu transposase C-terminal domain-containing protein n=1 Tax=Burkholderia sp. SRS-W-2-2016 TaxID=1926878 RepID=UPI00094B76CC|nr:Mu transposase C-terminal domain-containing protein [Burkholderia sp. SRS-W-2-2016]OLL33748.1 integrase [Burkholderia sp. SRS-W-2-2016]